jgi:hypothetical protein
MGVTLPNQGVDVCFGTSREAESLHLANPMCRFSDE